LPVIYKSIFVGRVRMKKIKKLRSDKETNIFDNEKISSRIISAEELRAMRDPYSVKAQSIIKKVSENLLHVKRDELLEGYLYLYGCQKEAITKH
jgi:hypothetical protein